MKETDVSKVILKNSLFNFLSTLINGWYTCLKKFGQLSSCVRRGSLTSKNPPSIISCSDGFFDIPSNRKGLSYLFIKSLVILSINNIFVIPTIVISLYLS